MKPQLRCLARHAQPRHTLHTLTTPCSYPALIAATVRHAQRRCSLHSTPTSCTPSASSIGYNKASGSTATIKDSTNPTTSDRPYRILGVQQIAIGGTDKNKLSNLWGTIFGLKKVNTYKSEKENVDEDIYEVGVGELGTVEVDLMQPLDINKKPAVHVPTLNHIGLWVDDIHKCVEYLTQHGCRFTPGGVRKGAAGYDVTFIHPKGSAELPLSGEGVLIELVQAPPHVIEAYERESATQRQEFVAQ